MTERSQTVNAAPGTAAILKRWRTRVGAALRHVEPAALRRGGDLATAAERALAGDAMGRQTIGTTPWRDVDAALQMLDHVVVEHGDASATPTDVATLRDRIASARLSAAFEEIARLEERTSTAADTSERLQQLLSRFVATASHDVRTPLTAVLGFGELLLDGSYGPLNDAQHEALGHIVNSAQNLLEVVNNLLDLMRIRSNRLELQRVAVDMDAILLQTIGLLEPLAVRREVRFEPSYEGDAVEVVGDEAVLRHILYQLLGGTMRAAPSGSVVRMVRAATPSAWSLRLFDEWLHVPAVALRAMLDPFPRHAGEMERGYEGLEIGLSLVRRYAEYHGGSLELSQTGALGTEIRVTLPVRPLNAPRTSY